MINLALASAHAPTVKMRSSPHAQQQLGPDLKQTDISEGVLSGLDDWSDKKECYTVRDKQEESGRAANRTLSFVWM